MSKWNRLGKHRACPVCGGERKDCRSLDLANGITQYHCRTDNPNPDFELKKPDQLGFGIYFKKAELDAQSQQQKEDWIRQRQAEKKAREEREAKEYAEGLPVELRDREFRKLLSQLSLNPNHRADLERRGLTPEQIEKGMFRSVSKDGTFLNTPISQYLPGAWDWGKSFKSPVDGYLCPILNDNGLIIGGQVRVDGGGYVWLKTKKSSHLQNGELPITAHITEGDKNLRLVEGILKPQVAHCRRGQTYIGAAGGNFANSPQQIKQYIDYVQPQKIILCPDAGSRANKNVLRQYRAIANLLNSWGHELWVESWGQADSKDNCDVDEIDPNTPTNIIPFSEWDVDKPKERLWRNSPTPENELARQDNWFSQFRASLKTWQKQLNTTTPAEAQTISFYNTPTQLLANKLGETLIGCDSSGDFLTNKNALLKFLTDHDKTVPLRLYPSVGYQSNKALSYYKKLGEWLTNKGYQLEVGWYEQWHEKSPALLDFISSGDEIKYLSWPEFLDKNRYSKLCYKRNKEFTANIEYDQQYLDGEEIAKQIIQPRSLTAIKSPMGTGKTVLIGKIKEQFPDKGSFLIAHRNSLLQQSCKELGFTHMRFEDAYHLTRRPGTHLAFCPDSITRIDHKDLENRIVYLDEISSILPHILIGATCKKHRKHIIDKFTYMLRHAFAVVSLDANQKNWEVDHLLKLGQFDISTKIQNIYEKKPLKITFYNGTEKNPNDFLPVVVDIKRNYINGKTQVICSDSQNFTEFLHQYLGGKDNKEIIRIDGQTISEDWIRKLIKNPNSIAALGCKVLIYSPTMDTGVSITLANYFNAAYSLNFHLGAEAFSQLPGRIRDTEVPWTHWSKQFLGSDDDGIRSSDPEKVVLHLLTSVFSDAKISFPGLSEEDRECLKRAAELLARSQDDNFYTSCLIKAQQNYEKQNLRETYYEKLIEDGHNVKQVWGAAGVEDDKWKGAKEEVKNRYSELLYKAEDLSILEAEEIQQSLDSTPEKQRAAAKTMLTQVRLPGLMDTPLWKEQGKEFLKFLKYEDRKCISRLELRHILHNPKLEICRQQAWMQWLNIGVESDTGAIDQLILTDIYSPQFRAQILRDIGVLDFIQNAEGKIFDNESPELKAIARKANHWTRQPYLGRRGKLSLIQYFNCRILGQVGYKLTVAKQQDGKRYYKLTDIYSSALPITPNLMPIIAAKYESKFEAAQTYMEKASQSIISPPIMDLNKEKMLTIETPTQTGVEAQILSEQILGDLPEPPPHIYRGDVAKYKDIELVASALEMYFAHPSYLVTKQRQATLLEALQIQIEELGWNVIKAACQYSQILLEQVSWVCRELVKSGEWSIAPG